MLLAPVFWLFVGVVLDVVTCVNVAVCLPLLLVDTIIIITVMATFVKGGVGFTRILKFRFTGLTFSRGRATLDQKVTINHQEKQKQYDKYQL